MQAANGGAGEGLGVCGKSAEQVDLRKHLIKQAYDIVDKMNDAELWRVLVRIEQLLGSGDE